jgi:hypothetical protein
VPLHIAMVQLSDTEQSDSLSTFTTGMTSSLSTVLHIIDRREDKGMGTGRNSSVAGRPQGVTTQRHRTRTALQNAKKDFSRRYYPANGKEIQEMSMDIESEELPIVQSKNLFLQSQSSPVSSPSIQGEHFAPAQLLATVLDHSALDLRQS